MADIDGNNVSPVLDAPVVSQSSDGDTSNNILTTTNTNKATDDDAVAVVAGGGGGGGGGPPSPQVSSKHWRKIRSAVTALAAFKSRRVKVSDFERIRMCGEGGSGLVYLVKLRDTSMFFALKVQRKLDLEAKEKRIRRALIEKEVLVACAHPFVCNLYTAFQDSRHLYLVMDFCAGGDLHSLLRKVVKRPLKEEEARFYVSEIVVALEWVHLHGYVYRDLKPENVLIHESGHIRLGDFGTAERGSMQSCDLPGEKLRPEEVESALPDKSGSSAGGKLSMQSVAPAQKKVALEQAAATAAAAAVVAAPLGGGSRLPDTEEEEEADVDDGQLLGGDLDETVKSSIVVQIDPLLEKRSLSNAAPKITTGAAATAGDGTTAAAAPADTPRGSDCAAPCVDDYATEQEASRAVPSRKWRGCCGGKGRVHGAERTARAPAQGSAKAFANGRGSVKLNVLLDSRTFIGTADFMAPEMVTGKERQGTAMDWWALGVMLYEMLLGTLPFHTELTQSSNEVFRRIVKAELMFPRGHKLSRSAVDLIQQLLRKDPAERLGSRKGVGEIKRHPFFRGVHWALVANATPPFVVPGPDTPGWAASVASAPAESRDDKLATWTWMATKEKLRPAMPAGVPVASEQSQDCLDVSSEHYSRTKLSEPRDSLGASAQPREAAAAAAAAATKGGNGHRTPDLDSKINGSEGGTPAQSNGNAGMPDLCASASTGAKESSGKSEVDRPKGGGGGGVGSTTSVSPNPNSTLKFPPPTAAAAAAVADSKGSARNAEKSGKTHSANKASFDGYDFNTTRRVGSVGMNRLIHGQPQLTAKRSLDSATTGMRR